MTNSSANSSSLPDIYLCSLCGKPFTNKTSQDRHRRYCGSRTRSRRRSCRACNTAKRRCSFDSPCSQCLKRDISCTYEPTTSTETHTSTPAQASIFTPRGQPSSDSRSLPLPDTGSVNIGQSLPGSSAQDSAFIDTRLTARKSTSSLLKNPAIQTSLIENPITFEDLFAIEDYDMSLYQFSKDVSIDIVDNADRQVSSWCNWMRGGVSLTVASESNALASTSNMLTSMFIEHPYAQHNAHLILQSLRCLPVMMLRRETFPWFIHSQSHLLSAQGRNTLPEALLTCMSISQMYALRTTETRGIIWKNIKAEHTRITRDMIHLSSSDLLAALQACMIYLIICINTYKHEDEEDAVQFLFAIHDIYMFTKKAHGAVDSQTTMSSWEAWILTESRHRLAILWFLVGMVMCVKTGVPCDPSQSYRSLSLPAAKSLWEAPTETTWRSEFEANNIQPSGLVNLGNLIDAQQSCHTPANTRKLERWNAGIDSAGSLLNLVEAMV